MFSFPITIEQQVNVKQGNGEPIPTWETFAEVLADKTHKAGGTSYFARKLVENEEVVYTIRYIPGITSNMRVLDGTTSEYLFIEEVVPEGRFFNLHLRCSRAVADNM